MSQRRVGHLNDAIALLDTRLSQFNIDVEKSSPSPPKTSTRRQRLRQTFAFELRKQAGRPLVPQQVAKIASRITEVLLSVVTNGENNFKASIRRCGLNAHKGWE